MAKEIGYLKLGGVVTVDNPTWEKVRSRLEEIGQGVYVCHLTIPQGTLSIGYTNDRERVTVTYSDSVIEFRHQGGLPDNWRKGRLIDITYANSDATIGRVIDGVPETELLYRTVSKALAIEVAEYFWNKEAIPDGYDWDGTMGKGNEDRS